MSDDTNETSSTDGSIDAELAQVTSTYKILGQFSNGSGVGVLGQNDAGSGTPVGVEGAVPNATDSGYGLKTDHDARVGGVAELDALGGSVTGGTELTNLTGDDLSIDGSGNLTWDGTYEVQTFSAAGTDWNVLSGAVEPDRPGSHGRHQRTDRRADRVDRGRFPRGRRQEGRFPQPDRPTVEFGDDQQHRLLLVQLDVRRFERTDRNWGGGVQE